MIRKGLSLALGLIVLSGCSSADSDKQHQLELMASNRAGALSSGLPIESGPLKIMRVYANKNVVEMMMIYNDGAPGALPIQQVAANSISKYCSDPQVRPQIDMGLMYRIKMRNARGQLMVDELVSSVTCEQLNQ